MSKVTDDPKVQAAIDKAVKAAVKTNTKTILDAIKAVDAEGDKGVKRGLGLAVKAAKEALAAE